MVNYFEQQRQQIARVNEQLSQTEQGILQQKALLEAQKKSVSEFNPRVEATQQQLRQSGNPLMAMASIGGLEAQRQIQKQQALNEFNITEKQFLEQTNPILEEIEAQRASLAEAQAEISRLERASQRDESFPGGKSSQQQIAEAMKEYFPGAPILHPLAILPKQISQGVENIARSLGTTKEAAAKVLFKEMGYESPKEVANFFYGGKDTIAQTTSSVFMPNDFTPSTDINLSSLGKNYKPSFFDKVSNIFLPSASAQTIDTEAPIFVYNKDTGVTSYALPGSGSTGRIWETDGNVQFREVFTPGKKTEYYKETIDTSGPDIKILKTETLDRNANEYLVRNNLGGGRYQYVFLNPNTKSERIVYDSKIQKYKVPDKIDVNIPIKENIGIATTPNVNLYKVIEEAAKGFNVKSGNIFLSSGRPGVVSYSEPYNALKEGPFSFVGLVKPDKINIGTTYLGRRVEKRDALSTGVSWLGKTLTSSILPSVSARQVSAINLPNLNSINFNKGTNINLIPSGESFKSYGFQFSEDTTYKDIENKLGKTTAKELYLYNKNPNYGTPEYFSNLRDKIYREYTINKNLDPNKYRDEINKRILVESKKDFQGYNPNAKIPNVNLYDFVIRKAFIDKVNTLESEGKITYKFPNIEDKSLGKETLYGYYNSKEQKIVSTPSTFWLSHELGHLLDYGSSENKQSLKSASNLPFFVSREAYSPKEIGSERVAVAFSKYIQNPTDFTKKYPEIGRDFENKLITSRLIFKNQVGETKDNSMDAKINVSSYSPQYLSGNGKVLVSTNPGNPTTYNVNLGNLNLGRTYASGTIMSSGPLNIPRDVNWQSIRSDLVKIPSLENLPGFSLTNNPQRYSGGGLALPYQPITSFVQNPVEKIESGVNYILPRIGFTPEKQKVVDTYLTSNAPYIEPIVKYVAKPLVEGALSFTLLSPALTPAPEPTTGFSYFQEKGKIPTLEMDLGSIPKPDVTFSSGKSADILKEKITKSPDLTIAERSRIQAADRVYQSSIDTPKGKVDIVFLESGSLEGGYGGRTLSGYSFNEAGALIGKTNAISIEKGGDTTQLLTRALMQQYKPTFSGELKPIQKTNAEILEQIRLQAQTPFNKIETPTLMKDTFIKSDASGTDILTRGIKRRLKIQYTTGETKIGNLEIGKNVKSPLGIKDIPETIEYQFEPKFKAAKPEGESFGIRKITTEEALRFTLPEERVAILTSKEVGAIIPKDIASKAIKSLEGNTEGFWTKQKIKEVSAKIDRALNLKPESAILKASEISSPLKPKAQEPLEAYTTSQDFGGLRRELSLYKGGQEPALGTVSTLSKLSIVELPKGGAKISTLGFPVITLAPTNTQTTKEEQKSIQKEFLLTSPSLKVENTFKSSQLKTQVPRETQLNVQIPKVALGVGLVQKVSQKQEQKQSPFQIPTPIPPNVPIGKRIIKPGIGKPIKLKGKKLRAREGLYIPQIRRRGKFFAISKPTSYSEAVSKGLGVVKTSLAASFRVSTQKGELVPFRKPITPEIRYGKSGKDVFTLVQKTRKRLVSYPERREIVASRRRRIKFL